MSRLLWLLLSAVLLAGCNNSDSGATGPAGPAGPQGEQGPPASQPNMTCAADQALTLTANGWSCVSPAPSVVLRAREGRQVDNTWGFTALPVTNAQITVSCPDGWQLVRVNCTSHIPTVVASRLDHRQLVRGIDSSVVYGNQLEAVWVADSGYVLQHDYAAGYSEKSTPFDIVLPAGEMNSNAGYYGGSSSGTCTFNGTVGAASSGELFADGVCVNAPTSPTGPGTCDLPDNCPPL